MHLDVGGNKKYLNYFIFKKKKLIELNIIILNLFISYIKKIKRFTTILIFLGEYYSIH